MFGRILVVIDGTRAGRDGLAFGADLVQQFGASVWVHDVPARGRGRRLVQGIAAEAGRREADLIVLGLDRARPAHRHTGGSLAEQVGRATALPVMVTPAGRVTVPAPDQPGLTRV
jgi:nucleotide-binding universal stress UspA family protein